MDTESPAFTIKRKPLPEARHGRSTKHQSLNEDTIPLVPIDFDLAWSPPPDVHHVGTTYSDSRDHIEDDSAQSWPGKGFNTSKADTGYAKLGPYNKQHDDNCSTRDSLLSTFQAQKTPRMWNSIWLHWSILSLFIALYVALFAGLLILWHFAKIQNGLSVSITKNHYAWSYGPTALLVIIGAAWRRVDYNCRVLAPWRHLRTGNALARDSLLLDYMSPILPQVLYEATVRGDWDVVASGLSLLVLRAVIVFSTVLLVLTPTTVSTSIDDAQINSKFVGTYLVNDSVSLRSDEAMRFYGIRQYGLKYPYGTTADVAYETLGTDHLEPNVTLATTVNGIYPIIDCEIIKPQVVNWTWQHVDSTLVPADVLKLNMTMTSKRCPRTLIARPSLCQPTQQNCSRGRMYFSEGSFRPYSYYYDTNIVDVDPCANIFEITMTEIEYESIAGHPINTSSAWNVSFVDTTGLICTIAYSVKSIDLNVDTNDLTAPGNINISNPRESDHRVLPGFSYRNLTSYFVSQASVYGLRTPSDNSVGNDFSKMVMYLAGGSISTLMDSSVLKTTTELAIRGMGVQIVDHFLRQPDDRRVEAIAVSEQSRLMIRMTSVWAMGAGFLILTLLAILVLIWRPRDVISQNPGSIASAAAVLTSSYRLQRYLNSVGAYSDKRIKKHLRGMTASTRVSTSNVDSVFSIDLVSTKDNDSKPEDTTSDQHFVWWRPLSTSTWFMAIAISSPLVVITLLEILQRKSDAGSGFVSIAATSSVVHSLPSVLASAILLSIAMMYDAIDFAAATLAPYQALVRGSAAAKYTICGNLFGDLPIKSKLKTFSFHQSTTLTLLATFIGSFLTIVASGLYTVETVFFTTHVNIVAADRLIPTFNTTVDGDAGAIFNLIEHNNASYPSLTYDELAYPAFNISSLGTRAMQQLNRSETVIFRSRVPAMRASLNCTLVPQSAMVQTPYIYKTCLSTIISFNASLPQSCPVFLDNKNNTITKIEFSQQAQFGCPGPGDLPAARGNVIHSKNGDFLGWQQTTLGAPSNPPECPSLAFMYGYYELNRTSLKNITAMTCIQGLEEVYADTLFEVTGDAIQIKAPPLTDEGSRRWVTAFNSTYWFTSYPYFDGFYPEGAMPDYFYQAVHFGPDGIPGDELAGPANVDRFVNATQHIYRRFMAQLISGTMRRPFNNSDQTNRPQYAASISNIPVQRLVQNATSKLILQIFLAIMLACSILVYSLRDMRHVLPCCPWSIAGVMSLLAGSEMIDRKVIPAGTEFMDDKHLLKTFDGYVFSLGWWNTAANLDTDRPDGRKRFGIDIGKAELSAREGRKRWFR